MIKCSYADIRDIEDRQVRAPLRWLVRARALEMTTKMGQRHPTAIWQQLETQNARRHRRRLTKSCVDPTIQQKIDRTIDRHHLRPV